MLFTSAGIDFELITFPAHLYLVGFALCLVPVVVKELSKAFGLIKHQH